MIRDLFRKCVASALSALLILPSGAAGTAWAAEAAPKPEAVSVEALEVGSDEVRVRLSGEAQYNSFVTAKPPRLILQLIGTEYQAGAKTFVGKGKYLTGVRAGQFERVPNMISRVVMDLSEATGYRVTNEKNLIIVKLGVEGAESMEAPPRPKVSAPAAKGVGETGGMTSDMSPELAAMAAKGDVTKGEGGGGASPAAAAETPVASKIRMPRADIMSRLPRDLVSLDFDNTDIKDVLKLLAAKARVNIIYGADVAGSLTLHLTDVPFNEAFRTTLSMMGLATMQVGDNILRILTPSALAKSQTSAATATKVIPLNYSKAGEIAATVNTVRSAAGRTGSTLADTKTNSLIVTESLEGMAETERLVAQLDIRPKQVLIEVKLIEVGLNNSLSYGIQWDYLAVEPSKIGGKQGTNLTGTTLNPLSAGLVKPLDNNAAATIGVGGSARGTGVNLPASQALGALTFGRITNNYFLSATLTAAAAQGKVKVLSDPKVATLNNLPATINVTTSIPYITSNVASTGVTSQSVTYVVTGIQLTVTPSINADGRITLLVNPNVSQPSATAAVAGGAPAVDSRNASTTVLVKDGETIVIGGLISDSVSNRIAKIPILGDIPILGWLFKTKTVSRTRSELLIFVTPKIMPD